VARSALDGVRDGVCVCTEDWTILYLNPAAAAVVGRPVNELTGKNIWTEFPEALGSEHEAWRVDDQVLVVFAPADEPRAKAERQRLTSQVHDALTRSQMLLAASEAFTAATTMAEISVAVANLVSGQPRSPAYVDIALLEPDGQHLTRLRNEVLPIEIRHLYQRIPLTADQPAAECVRTGRPVFVENLEQLAERYPLLHADWAAQDRQATACAPVPGPDGPLGALVFVWASPQTIDVTEQAIITAIAGYAGHAVSRLRALEQRVAEVRVQYEDTRAAMLLMQRNLLPRALPVMPGLHLAAHYRAADSEHTAGGDWFDAIPVGQGQLALAVGDVVGHGAAAAAVMGQLRAVLAVFLVEGADASEALARLDRFVARVPGARGATAWVGVLDSRQRLLHSASCGHPSPMVITMDGRHRKVPLTVGGPLGLPGPAHQVTETSLVSGELLLCYSDGLVERAGRGLEDGLTALGRAAAAARLRFRDVQPASRVLDLVCELTVDTVTRAGQRDDATLLAVEVVEPSPSPIRIEIDSYRPELARLRCELTAWLGSVGASAEDARAINLAVGEAVENSIEHGYRDSRGTVEVEGALSGDGRASFTITDRGRWRTPPADPMHRGRGMIMMRQWVDTLEIEDLGAGTMVSFDRELRRAPVFGSTPAEGTEAADPASEMRITVARTGDRPCLVVSGPVDMTTAGPLRRRLRDISRGGLLPLSVDLTAVTHLGSVGIELLYEIAEETLHRGHTLRLIAPDGSPAAQAVRLSGLDSVATLLNEATPEVDGHPSATAQPG
jgi:serine phosphatase RsbU (regulator of sigma subunit)/anti-sigma regulatory factor (Ser/Thr protein kinase)/anti-anti-sigma regulatory factor